MNERDRILIVETSTRTGSIALVEGAAESTISALLDPLVPHDRDLVPAIERLLRSRGIHPQELTGLVLGRGPGSFTGLRVGAATVLGLHQALRIPVLGRPSLEATAIAALRLVPRVAIALDARRGAFFVARYERGPDGALHELLAPRLCEARDLLTLLPADEPLWSDAEPLLAEHLPAARGPRLDDGSCGPRAAELWLAARRLWPPPPSEFVEEQLLPLYLRASSPEEKRERALGSPP
ncbi:MAG: tRNA (adenosine(37)-N6)-threonylcarbamoyltransferase complex dimerization subunit type 1 TsaB [Planctomycetes bacterium]|nr:tRNA (adenosine(37)-N6)-threonylcarbamoyltransferase complex dimerization subunit type 1 TsaB [Planctomycetota bacterium]